MTWTAAVALSVALVVLTLIGVVGFWWAVFTAEYRQAPVEAGAQFDRAATRDIRRPSDQ